MMDDGKGEKTKDKRQKTDDKGKKQTAEN